MHHSNPAPLCALFLSILLAGSANLHAERFLYSFSGRVKSIYDPSGLLTPSNYYRTGDVVSASFIVDTWAVGFAISDERLIVENDYYNVQLQRFYSFFYCRLVSGPLMPSLRARPASHSSGHLLYGMHYQTNVFADVGSTTLVGGNNVSQFSIVGNGRDGWIEGWREGLEVTGIATGDTDAITPTVLMDMRLDSITPAFNHHDPKPVISIHKQSTFQG